MSETKNDLTLNPPDAHMDMQDNIWGVSTFFNPAGYQNKRSNFLTFATRIRRQGLKLLVMELTFDNDAPSLPEEIADLHVVLNSADVLWQKERLLNLALDLLPASCKQVAWLDGDIMFGKAAWVQDAQQALVKHSVIQLFDTAYFLPPPASIQPGTAQAHGWVSDSGRHSMESVGKAYREGKLEQIISGRRQPGLAWAARRELLEQVRFYDKLVLGGGDTLMVFALLGLHNHENVRSTFQAWWSPALLEDVMGWAARLSAAVEGNVGYIASTVYHLWHGNRTNRAYGQRHALLCQYEFDPECDLALDSNGCWRWATDKPELHDGVRKYFYDRREDLVGPTAEAVPAEQLQVGN
jgi:hypothetical protein